MNDSLRRAMLALVPYFGLCVAPAESAEIVLVVDTPLGPAAKLAVADLKATLVDRGHTTRDAKEATGGVPHLIIGLAGKSTAVDAALAAAKLVVPAAAESRVG